jgi:MFS family permease
VILGLACLPVFIGALDLTVISAVLPAVISDLRLPLQTGLDDAAWAVSGYLLAYAVSMAVMGRASDLWGRRRVYLICLAVFAAGSWLVAASGGLPTDLADRAIRGLTGGRPDRSQLALYALIAGRVVQAFGAGALVPVSMALVGDLLPVERRAIGVGVVGAVDTAGWVLGHLYGGVVVQFFPWTYLFWINLPIAALSFGLVARALRDLPLPERQAGWPLVDLRLFRDRTLAAAFGANLLVGFCLMVGLVSVPLFINLVGAESSEQGALASGVLLSAFTIPMALAAIPGGWLAGRFGERTAALLGALLALLGFGLMTRWESEYARQATLWVASLGEPGSPARELTTGTLRMAGGLTIAGVGLGLTIAPIGSTVINRVSDAERGLAAALVIVLRLVGMTFSVTTLTEYGLRRTTALSQSLLEGVPLTDFARLAEVAIQVATQITREMSGIGLAVCALAIVPILLLGGGRAGRTPGTTVPEARAA